VPVRAGIVAGRPATAATDAVGAILLAAARMAAAGAWPRLKLCAAETCRWAFFDESRNRSRSWCSMDVCGNRAKARSFRARKRHP
jgi:predicted RNA-binding Zn ribbon-like protein